MNEIAPISQNSSFLKKYEPSKISTGTIGRHHRQYYDDYEACKAHILQSVGDFSGIRLFSKQVLVAVYCKPGITPGGIIMPEKDQKEDWWQSKTCLILKTGPSAFIGDQSYHDAVFGESNPRPQAGDWMFSNASSGMQISLRCEGASRPRGKDIHGNVHYLFPDDGWPCRVMADDCFVAQVDSPHHVV